MIVKVRKVSASLVAVCRQAGQGRQGRQGGSHTSCKHGAALGGGHLAAAERWALLALGWRRRRQLGTGGAGWLAGGAGAPARPPPQQRCR